MNLDTSIYNDTFTVVEKTNAGRFENRIDVDVYSNGTTGIIIEDGTEYNRASFTLDRKAAIALAHFLLENNAQENS